MDGARVAGNNEDQGEGGGGRKSLINGPEIGFELQIPRELTCIVIVL